MKKLNRVWYVLILAFLFSYSESFAMNQLSASTQLIVFNNTRVGTRETQRVIITNNGDIPAESINFTTNCGFEFYNQNSDCINGALEAHKTCYVDVTYRPYEESFSQCLVEVHSNNGHVHVNIEAQSAP